MNKQIIALTVFSNVIEIKKYLYCTIYTIMNVVHNGILLPAKDYSVHFLIIHFATIELLIDKV